MGLVIGFLIRVLDNLLSTLLFFLVRGEKIQGHTGYIHMHTHKHKQLSHKRYTLETVYILASGLGNPILSNL